METDGLNNVSINISSYSDQPISPWFEATKIMKYICIPVIVCLGLFGNTLTLMVFSMKRMRYSSSSVFLASLAFVDNTFLICLLITWIDGEIQPILVNDFACQFLIFFTYVTSCLSVWFIVCFTFERFFAICFPLKSSYTCSMYKEKGTVAILTALACMLYNFSFWTTGMKQIGPKMRCTYNPKYIQFLNAATWIDTLLTMVLPFFLIASMNSMVLRSVIKCKKNAKEQKSKHMRCDTRSAITLNKPILKSAGGRPSARVNTRSHWKNPRFRVTRTMLFVSTTFLVLNLPSHTMRLYNLISVVASDSQIVSAKFSFLQELALVLYYMTFSCNFFLYTSFGQNFRRSLYLIISCTSAKEEHRREMLLKFSSSHGRSS